MQGGMSRKKIRKKSDKELIEKVHQYLDNYEEDSPIRQLVDESSLYADIKRAASKKKYNSEVIGLIGEVEDREIEKVFSDEDNRFMKTIRGVQLFILAKDIRFPYHKPQLIMDKSGKERYIASAGFSQEAIIHYAIIRLLKPQFLKGMYHYSCSGVRGRGVHYALIYARRAVLGDPEGSKYALLADIRECYENIKQSILKDRIREIVKDRDVRRILYRIIEAKKGNGLVTGFMTSEWFLNLYLEKMDHYIKERILDDIYGANHTLKTGRHGAKYYFRYADNILILHPSKKELHAMKRKLDVYLKEELGLRFKYDWQIFLVDTIDKDGTRRGRYIDFLGFKIYRDHVTLRTKVYKKIRRLIKIMKKKEIYQITAAEAAAMISYHGLIYWTDAHGLYEKMTKPYISLKQLKKIVAIEKKRHKKLLKKLQLEREEEVLKSMERKMNIEEERLIRLFEDSYEILNDAPDIVPNDNNK